MVGFPAIVSNARFSLLSAFFVPEQLEIVRFLIFNLPYSYLYIVFIHRKSTDLF